MFWIGLPFVVVGQGIRLWSSGYLSKLERLVTAGPFAHARNPLYIGSFLMCVGFLFMCSRLDAAIAGLVLFWLFHGGAIAYEERLLRDKFGEEFVNYCNCVPRFIPCLRANKGHGEFSIQQLLRNNEYKGLSASFVATCIFGLMAFGVLPSPSEWLRSLIS